MSELVLLHHNEPMTTSEAIAEGVDLAHKTVIQLVRKYVSDLSEWGEVAFQMRLNHQGSPTEFAYLNEGQSMFLMTLMRNSTLVVAFKKALVNAFLEMRDRLRGEPGPQFVTSNLSHGADLAVAADRTFRSFLRAGRSAGLPLPAALRTANRQTLARTGMDMLKEIGLEVPEVASNDAALRIASDFVARWLAGELPVPACVCHSADLHLAYQRWCAESGVLPMTAQRFHPALRRLGIGKLTVEARNANGETFSVRISVPPGGIDAELGGRGRFYAESVERFALALRNWS